MIIKFDRPITIEEARNQYNNTVKFLTSTESYPTITGIEFDETAHQTIFKKEAIDPKVTKQANKIIGKYSKSIVEDWKDAFTEIRNILGKSHKQETLRITKEQKDNVRRILKALNNTISSEAKERYRDAFQLGKLRGQVISRQEVDTDLTEKDEQDIEERLLENEQYLAAFSKDLQADMDKIMDQPYETLEELEEAVLNEEKVRKSRALMYPLAILGLITAGTILTLKVAKEEQGEVELANGQWTLHPIEGLGGEVCEGCLNNAGKWFSLDKFLDEYQQQDCLTNCRCDLRFDNMRLAP